MPEKTERLDAFSGGGQVVLGTWCTLHTKVLPEVQVISTNVLVLT